MSKTLYQELTAAGIETANHCSDLYFPVTPESTEIVNRYYPGVTVMKKTFRNEINGERWYDVPFAFDPYWEAREKK